MWIEAHTATSETFYWTIKTYLLKNISVALRYDFGFPFFANLNNVIN